MNHRRRQRAIIRAGISLVLALVCGGVYLKNTEVWLLFLAVLFTIFSIVPILLIQCKREINHKENW